MKKKGKVIIFAAPSGAGKSTVVKHLIKNHPEFEFSTSVTTRFPRGSEKDGVDYFFVDTRTFDYLISQNLFIEYEEVYAGCFYGTLKSEIELIWQRGNIVLFDVDVKGGMNLKKYFGDNALSVLITPPSMGILKERLYNRGTDTEESIQKRLAKAESELEFAKGKFDIEIINDKLDDTFNEIDLIINDWCNKNKI